MRHRSRAPRRHRLIRRTAALVALCAAALLLRPAAADDRDLLRFDSAKPYLFIVLDTSASMAMTMGHDEWAPGGADGPDSRLYQAKQALFNVLKDVDDVHFGFAGFNQDGVHAVEKHWLYYNEERLVEYPRDWPIDFPRADEWDSDGDGSVLTWLRAIPRVDADGDIIPIDPTDPDAPTPDTRVSEIGRVDVDGDGDLVEEADLLTFGTPFPSTVGTDGRVVAGTCSDPLDLGDPEERDRVESLAISPSSVNPTWFWLRGSGNTKYLLSVRRPGNKPDGTVNAVLGQDRLHILFELRRISNCNTAAPFDLAADFTLRRNLRIDPELSQFFYVNQETWAAGEGNESTMELWEHSDIVSETLFDSHPHTGRGWEGNYDSGVVTADTDFDDFVTKNDFGDDGDGITTCAPFSSCIKPVSQTIPADERALDRGDVIPFDWEQPRRSDLLSRLDPTYPSPLSSLGDFRVARHFGDTTVDGALPLLAANRVPLVAADLSPLARALTDVRCWYLGGTGPGSNKCKDDMFDDVDGWSDVACGQDASFGCRRNFLIVIGDGEDNVAGQDANGSIGNLKNAANMQTWALNLGNPRGCNSGGGLHSIVRAGGGECVNVESQERLRQVLESLLGQIRTTARSFASAAVPSVQATVEQKIFLTSFLPFNDEGVWKGSVHSFLKPLPVSPAGVPLTEQKCDGSGSLIPDQSNQECHLWDAGEMLITKQYPALGNDYLDYDDIAKRRVFYALQSGAAPGQDGGEGEWPLGMRLFDPALIATPGSQDVRFDLWRGLQIPFDPADDTNNTTEETIANQVVDFVLRFKQGTESNPDADPPVSIVHQYLLGDIFHSTPVVIGTPSNTVYFASDLYGNDEDCDPDDGTAAANPGYRCFFEKQRFRRKMLLVGSNDGMLHAFDAGMFRTGGTDFWTGVNLVEANTNPFGSFDNGTGKELFGYIPRSVLPTMLKLKDLPESHEYSVDGTVTVADVFIDPVAQASSTFPLEDDREWRTVVVGGLREGGTGYYGLDITQPDPVETDDDLGFVPETASSGSNNPTSGDYVPVCTAELSEVANTGGVIAPPTESGCGPVPFPAVLWEFTDTYFDPVTGETYFADHEVESVDLGEGLPSLSAFVGNGTRDLADTWSTPNIGRIRICRTGGSACDPTPDDDESEDDDLVDMYVAIFGGGMDPDHVGADQEWRDGAPAGAKGNWLYMVDIETGEAIYKRQLEGAAPSEPAAVDTDGDGYLDRIYIGTLAGYLYRVDLGPQFIGGDDRLPAPQMPFFPTRPWLDSDGEPVPLGTVPATPRLGDVWNPVKIFDANTNGAIATQLGEPRHIFQRPSVIFQAGSGQWVLAFGTGDRYDLWSLSETAPNQRFYVFVDPFESTDDVVDPLTEADLVPIDPDVTPTTTENLLQTEGGWVMRLAPNERVITDAFALSGVTVFSTFVPRIEDGDGNETVVGCDFNAQSEVCSKQGLSHVFVVNTTNGNGLLFEGDVQTRYNVAPTFVTNPFAEPGSTQNTTDGNEEGEHTADDLAPNMIKVMESLKGLFPPQCKFANYRIDIKTVAADTSLQFIAPIPVCLIESNWKEF